jgi:hypothetical protein
LNLPFDEKCVLSISKEIFNGYVYFVHKIGGKLFYLETGIKKPLLEWSGRLTPESLVDAPELVVG